MKNLLIVLLLLTSFSRASFAQGAVSPTPSAPPQVSAVPAEQGTPLDQPNMDDPALLAWSASASADIMTFGFTDYQKRLQQVSRHFTKTGWEAFTAAIQRARIIDGITSLKQTVSSAPEAVPQLVGEGVVNGRYQWIVELPLIVAYKGDRVMREDKLKLHLVIVRVDMAGNPNGIGIEEWDAKSP